ncbi:MAG: M23 family metallopeptidase [Alphaproteobacteria bacterium]|nr:M23 family metallopeptidase [Alphaproteobacteria bacterium]
MVRSRPPALERHGRAKRHRPAPPRRTGRLTQSRATVVRVKSGETLYAISRRHRVPLRALIDANNLSPPYHLVAGASLIVPAVRVYVVGEGDTVWGIARRFDMTPGRIIRENQMQGKDHRLFTGQRLILPPRRSVAAARNGSGTRPVAKRTRTAPRPAARPKARTKSASVAPPPRPIVRRAPKANAPRQVTLPRTPPRSGTFAWPLRGRLISGYGAKGGGLYNDGINIAAREGAPVRATESGIVAYAGNELRGYGNLLLIKHAGGWVSAYAHTRAILVSKGETVRRGQTIAQVGRSGAVSRPQLHFELRRGPNAVDPMRYLGKKG